MALGRRDDLLSLMYVLCYFLSGVLPWQTGDESVDEQSDAYFKKVGTMKAEMTADDLCKGRTKHLLPMVRYVYSLAYEDRPDYDNLRELFETMALIQPQGELDWQKMVPKEKELNNNELTNNLLNMPKDVEPPSPNYLIRQMASGNGDTSPIIAEENIDSSFILPRLASRVRQNFIKFIN